MKNEQTIVITGASGYVGGELVRHLAKDGNAIHAIVRPSSNTAHIRSITNITLHTYDGSFASLERVAATIQADSIIHAAAQYVHPHTPEDMDAILEANVRFGCEIVEAFTLHGNPAFIHTGTYWQHAEGPDYYPNSFYAASKSAFEQLLVYYVKHRGLRAITLKLGDVYGENDPPYKLFGLLAAARKTGKPMLMTPGEQEMCLIHMDDVIDAYRLALQLATAMTPGTYGSYFAVGARRKLRDVVTVYLQQVQDPIEVVWGGQAYRPGQIMSPYAGQAVPGWKPHVTLEQGIERLLHAT